jgi:hypothetical protein
MKIAAAFAVIVLLTTTPSIAQDHVSRGETTDRLVAMLMPYKRIPGASFILKAGSCSISCTSGSSYQIVVPIHKLVLVIVTARIQHNVPVAVSLFFGGYKL